MNQLIVFLALLFFNLLYLWRILRWLSIIQQKEYRADRLKAYVDTPAGKKELAKYLPKKFDLTYQGLKRPKLSLRSLSVFLLFYLIKFLAFDFIAWQMLAESKENWLLVLITALIWYQLLPLLLFLASLPSSLGRFLVARFYVFKAKKLFKRSKPLIIGITGSYAKTSTKLILADMLRTKYKVFATPKSFNNYFSLPKAIADLYQGEEIVILEYAAYGKGEISRLAKHFPPQISIVSGFTPQHLALFGSVENILQAKSELVKATQDKNQVYASQADPEVARICRLGGVSKPIFYSADDLKANLDKQAYLVINWHGQKIKTNFLGKHYLQEVALAVKIAQNLKFNQTDLLKALKNLKAHERFLKLRTNSHQALFIDDSYSSNPKGFVAALAILEHFKTEHYQTVLVTNGLIDLGAASSSIHQEIAKQALDFTDKVYHLGKDGLVEFKQVFKQNLSSDEAELINLIASAKAKNVILLEGRMSKKVSKFLTKNTKVINANF